MEHDPIAEPWIDESRTKIKPMKASINRIYWTAFWANLGLACFKISIGMLGYSRLIVIDGLNSASNAVVITIILLGIQMSQPHSVSQEYPNGKGKAQYIITLIVGFLIAGCAATVLGISIKSFFLPINMEQVDIGIAVALISITGNMLLLHYLKQSSSFYEKEIQTIARLQNLNIVSSMILGNSLLLSGLFGWSLTEHIGSITISSIVLWLSVKIITSSLDGIMDRSCGETIQLRLTGIAASVESVMEVRFLRTRWAGQIMMVDLQICLKGDISIREADKIVIQVEKRLSADLKGVSHVITVDRRPV